jgi:hypothetical protein
MGTLEQYLDYLCPFAGHRVQIHIIYYCSNTSGCQINVEPAFYECLLSNNCPGYKLKDKDCLLFQFPEIR